MHITQKTSIVLILKIEDVLWMFNKFSLMAKALNDHIFIAFLAPMINVLPFEHVSFLRNHCLVHLLEKNVLSRMNMCAKALSLAFTRSFVSHD